MRLVEELYKGQARKTMRKFGGFCIPGVQTGKGGIR